MSLWEVRFSGAHFVVKVYLTFTRWRHIIIMPKGESVSSVYSATTEKTNPLGEATPRGFYHFHRLDYTGGFAALFSVKPFTNVVGDYTCQNRENESVERVHVTTSLHSRGLAAAPL